MVYGFVKQSLGNITIYSEVGQGTTIRIYLPQATGAAHAAEPVSPLRMEGGHETVLVVEDDPLVRTFVLAQVESLGYVTLTAANADEALTVINGAQEIDLLFTDLIMPGAMNGRQLANQALLRRPLLKVLFTSGYSEDAIIHNGRLDTGVLLLAKPYRKTELARMLRSALTTEGMLQPAPEGPVVSPPAPSAPPTAA
jgi:CheY-like chemotaxis protein